MQRKTYHFATSKSDDILYHHEMQEKQQSLRESQIRRISFDQKNNVNEQKRTSHYSITFKDESKKVSQAHVKKKLLTQIASFGYNAYMAEYLIEKQKVSLDQDYTKLLDFMIDQINTQESQYKSCPKLKQSTYRQIMPVSFEEQQKLQIDQFIEEPHSEYVSEKELTCSICMCEFMDKKKALNCKHEFCMKCLQDYLDNKINCGQVLEVECPQQGCDNFFTDEIIKSLVCDEQYQKYEKFKQMRLLEKDETVRWCVKPGCDKFVKGNVFSRIVKCECGQEMCYDCRREDHPGLTCDEALDKYYEQTLKQLIIQRCPKCKAPIQKKEGCNHMTCYQCRFQFCWLCRARYTRMHFDSDNCFGCPDKQFSTEDPLPRPRWKKYGGIIFEIFASTLILPLLPFILIYYSVLGPLKLLKHYKRSYYRGLDDGDKLCILFLGLMTFPITMILLIFPGAIMFLAYKLKYD